MTWASDFSGLKWLYPGMRIKRWLLLALAGTLLVALGFLWLVLGELGPWSPTWPLRPVLGVASVVAGGALVYLGLSSAIRSIVAAVAPAQGRDLASAVYARRQQERGPHVVGLGGGTGLATLLRGFKKLTTNLTAIVTVADDGGSSGRLRAEMGILPPGDVRMCLVALADTEPLMERLFQYRFKNAGSALSGHNFGNLFIAALTAITGDFEQAIRESSRVLAVKGQVLPSTLENVVLHAELADGRVIAGETDIAGARGRVRRVFFHPESPAAFPEVLSALENADLIVLGPGSLYTSVLPNLMVAGVADAIRRSAALKVYVCNIMTQPGETDGYSVADHVQAILDHAGPGVIDCVVVNTLSIPPFLREKYEGQGAAPVRYDPERLAELGVTPVTGPLASLTDLVRHDPDQLAATIFALLPGGRPGKRH